MLKPTIKGQGTTDREKYLAKLGKDTFFDMWSFPNVYTDEGKSKIGIGKELCDLLVIFNNSIIVFSDKDIKFHRDIDIKIAWKRWFKKAVIKSCNQLYGAESWIKKYSNRLYLDSNCSQEFPIDLSFQNFDFHLIAVTCNSNKPAEDYFNKNDTNSLFQCFPFDANKCLEKPFVIGDLFPEKTFVHVLDEYTLDLLLSELDTIADFLCYLREKEKAIRSGRIMQTSGEEELLAYYLNGKDIDNLTGKIIQQPEYLRDFPLSLVPGLWHSYKNSNEYKTNSELKKISTFWDELIERFSYHIVNATVDKISSNLTFDYHERAVRHLASEHRFARILLSKAFLDKLSEVPTNARSARLLFSPTIHTRLYVFLFFPRNNDEDSQSYRKQRFSYVQAYSLVAKYLHPEALDVVVLATETKGSHNHSEDIFSVEFIEPLSKDECNEAIRLMKQEKILNAFYKDRSMSLISENHGLMKRQKLSRNDKCFCGSGKKYKKCCL